jgi:hypothetical protein
MPKMQTQDTKPAAAGGKMQAPRPAWNTPLARDALGALILGGAGTAAAWFVGIRLLGSPYYFAWAIVAAMGLCVLLAWLLYLRDDAFLSKPREPEAGHSGTPRARKPPRRGVRTLILAAALLAALSLTLYFRFGIGAAP